MFRIGIQLDLIGGYGREALRGLMQYATLAGDWEFVMPPMYSLDRKRTVVAGEIDGAVMMLHDLRAIEPFKKARIPVVNIARTLDLARVAALRVPSVVPDDAAIGALAYEYLRERGFRSFGFCGHPKAAWSRTREQVFLGRARADGFAASSVDVADQVPHEWIASLPKPVGLLAANDRYAWHAVDVCREMGIRVPEDVAVLGVDNDLLLAELVRPALSSVQSNGFLVGIEAGRLLAALLAGGKPPAAPVLVAPEGIVTRHSTEVLKISDEAVVSAVRFIRLHAANPISVADVLEEVMVSRRNLERRFRMALGRSLLDEIRRVRIDRARELLRDTDFDMPVIAGKCGFMSHVRFSTVFRQITGKTPTDFRRTHRARRAEQSDLTRSEYRRDKK
jgi:LacI family transcriptional regulator